ncbi:uncharacterized protein E0L32_010419 [Thyridium curvatum]|uniref:Kinetochore protein SPC25 n=1 Tax=Thyridium curvatum TaxID=1093900 RepID=A0A507ANE9_9PEZI|nr:uncharacterized protein E0L32_010419 [Thyridium curvatum]TPX07844.1 hypothetical protein E0L32_010419 [Thyridium curvatum]
MATAFEPSLSTSRQTLTPMGPSVADQLPSINFGFDELRDRMAKFTAKFDAFIEQGRKRVLEERNQFRMNVAELQAAASLSHIFPPLRNTPYDEEELTNTQSLPPTTEDQRMKKKDIEILQVKTNAHQHTIAKEAAETREMQAAIAALSEQRDRQEVARDALRQQIADTQRDIDARLAAQRARQAQLEAQSRFNVPELDFWVTSLCLRIEGAGRDDHLRFVYTHVDERDWEREAWFELSTASRDYDVRHCRPKLEREKIERVLDRVNESRELVGLLKGMRELFVEAMKS